MPPDLRTVSGVSQLPAYGAPPDARPAPVNWGGVLLRMVLVALPGQLIGTFSASWCAPTGPDCWRTRSWGRR